jgi:predicted negative regulator of RcsB-dependent stress response
LSQYATQRENQFEATKGLLRCAYKAENWTKAAQIAKEIINDKNAAFDDVQMANMSLLQNSLIEKDTTSAIQIAQQLIKSNSTLITAEAHYILAMIQLNQNKLMVAEKTALDLVKKQAAYEFWVTKAYILLGDIYIAQKDNFNAIATYKSVIENANIETLKQIAQDKLKMISEDNLIKK